MAIRPSDQQRLDAMYAQYKGTFHGRREDYFPLLYLTRKFGTQVEEIAHQIAFNGNDYGIDAFHFDRASRNLYLYQFKWSEDHSQFKSTMDRLSKDGIIRVFGNPLQDRDQNDLLGYLKRELRENHALIDNVYLHFIFKGDPDAVENSEGLSQRREELESKAHLVAQFFQRDVGFLR